MFPNILDYTLLIYLVACYLLSSLRAGPKQAFSFLLLVLSFVLTGKSYEGVAIVFPKQVFPEGFAGAFGFLLTFLVIFGGVSLAARLLEDVLKRVSFGVVDNIVSRGLGILKGLVLGWMTIVIIMVNYTLDESPVLSESVSLPYVMPGVRITAKLLTPMDQKLFAQTDRELRMLWTRTKR